MGLMDSPPPITLVRRKEEEIAAASSDEHTNVTAADGKNSAPSRFLACSLYVEDVGNVL